LTLVWFYQPTLPSTPDLPLEELKIPGYGRELSEQGIHEFVNKN
jgi:hypothetical protein